jgi:LysR family transcriptional activator of nhaA
MFNLHHLHYFYVCAQTGSVTKAAAKLGISQPSLSAQIKQFERHIGMQLMVRSGRNLALTPKGKELYESSSRLFQEAEDIQRMIKKTDKIKEFDLRIGISDEVERPFMADVLGRLMNAHSSKKVTSTIVSGSHNEAVELLVQDDVDVIVTNQKVQGAYLFAEFKIPVVLACASSAEALRINNATNVQATLEKLGHSLILPMSQMVLGKETRDFLKSQGVKSVTSLQTNILACIARAVEEGVGAAFLPVAYVNFQIKKGLLKALGSREGYWQHTLYLYTLKGNQNEFLKDLRKIMADLNVLN